MNLIFQRYYVVGSNDSQTKFRVLKIDRTEPRELIISDDKIVYSEREIRDLLTMIDVGNRSKVGQKMGSGFNKTISSYGMIGFVRFLEGNYTGPLHRFFQFVFLILFSRLLYSSDNQKIKSSNVRTAWSLQNRRYCNVIYSQ